MATNLTFDNALKLFIRSNEAGKRYALACAHFAIQHFKDHGDLSLAQRFIDTLQANTNNYVRWRAFGIWMQKFTPCTYGRDGKFKKDRDRAEAQGDDAWKLEEAMRTSFWDAVPDRAQNYEFGDADIIAAFERIVKRYSNTKMVPLDDVTRARLERAKKLVGQLKAPIEPVAAKPEDGDLADLGNDEEIVIVPEEKTATAA